MILCECCGQYPVIPPMKRYCGIECYKDMKRIRERHRKTPPPPEARIRTCLGPCGRPFMSAHKYNRICSRCSGVIERFVPLNGM